MLAPVPLAGRVESMDHANLKKLLKSKHRELVTGHRIDLLTDSGGTVHVAHVNHETVCDAINRPRPTYAGRGAARVSVTLADLPAFPGNSCSTCEMYFFENWGKYNLYEKLPVADLIVCLETALTRVKAIGRINEKTTASAVSGRLSEMERLRMDLERLEPRASAHPAMLQRITEGLALWGTAKEALSSYAKGDDVKAKLEKKIMLDMVPSRYRDQDITLDKSPHLIGISPTGGWHGGNISAIFDAYALRSGKVTVLKAPAYIYSYLLQQLYPKSTGNTLVISTPAPEDDDLCEVIANIWDPEGEGALACLQKTVLSAQILQG